MLSSLQRAGILTEANRAVVANHAALFSEQARQLIWDIIPVYLLTQANFERLVIAFEHANPTQELQRVTAQIIGVVDVEARPVAATPAQAFNDTQSIHKPSVEHSVSQSALKLMNSPYGAPRKCTSASS